MEHVIIKVVYIGIVNPEGAGMLKVKKNNCDGYFDLMAIFGYLEVPSSAHEGIPTKKYTRVKLQEEGGGGQI